MAIGITTTPGAVIILLPFDDDGDDRTFELTLPLEDADTLIAALKGARRGAAEAMT